MPSQRSKGVACPDCGHDVVVVWIFGEVDSLMCTECGTYRTVNEGGTLNEARSIEDCEDEWEGQLH